MKKLTGLKVSSYTLGCKLNYAETSSLMLQLEAEGAESVHAGEKADICLINTCSVTEVANHKCRQQISKMTRLNPNALVIVTGCYAQLSPKQVASLKGVDIVLGNHEKKDIVEEIVRHTDLLPKQGNVSCHEYHTTRTADMRVFFPSCASGERTRYFLKVQDGCDYYCTYCTIPFARGRSRNGSIESIVNQAQSVAAQGGREIVITGVNIGDFGKTTGETFLDLIRALDGVDGIERYRISSIEPNLLTDDIIRFCASSRAFMPHFHIPLQSGSDEVLQLMRRHYDTNFFRSKIERVRELIPDAYIGVDVIVGTRGETNDLFEESYSFMESLPVSEFHVFSYSERPGTRALEIPHVVTPDEKHARSQRVIDLSSRKMRSFYEQYVGQVRPVLLEHSRKDGVMYGFTDNYIRVEYRCEEKSPSGLEGRIVPMFLSGVHAEEELLVVARLLDA